MIRLKTDRTGTTQTHSDHHRTKPESARTQEKQQCARQSFSAKQTTPEKGALLNCRQWTTVIRAEHGQNPNFYCSQESKNHACSYLLEELRGLIVEVDGQGRLSFPVLHDLRKRGTRNEERGTNQTKNRCWVSCQQIAWRSTIPSEKLTPTKSLDQSLLDSVPTGNKFTSQNASRASPESMLPFVLLYRRAQCCGTDLEEEVVVHDLFAVRCPLVHPLAVHPVHTHPPKHIHTHTCCKSSKTNKACFV